MVDMSGSIIPEFYNGRSVLITGATGFMGKILVEKLVRSCPDISSLYLLIRPTSTKNAQARLQDMINCEVRIFNLSYLQTIVFKNFHN